jgi:lanosterol synthase
MHQTSPPSVVSSASHHGSGALARALEHLASLQQGPGYFEGEMVWNTMLLSQWVIVQKMVGRPIDEERRRLILRHFEVTQLSDGSWPMHAEGPGWVFFTVLAYVAVRLLDVPPEHRLVAPARAWLRGKVLGVPTWGKFWLSMIGLYEYEGMNPVPPELFLMPDALPFHPNRFYCHTRYIYLGIAYLYGRRFRRDLGPITHELRGELYDEPYDRIDFSKHRDDLAPSDTFVRPSAVLRAAYRALTGWERLPAPVRAPLRRRALRRCEERIRYELMASRRQGISPVNGLLHCLALLAIDPSDPELGRAMDAMESWKWEDEAEGVRFCGAHSTAWDTAFAIRAITTAAAHTPLTVEAKDAVRAAYRWLEATQMQEELSDYERERRAPIRGGWCFSDGEHRWPVSDCTAEALTAILDAEAMEIVHQREQIARTRLVEAVQFILLRQNEDGGFGSYEARRGGALLELVNPSEMFGNSMTERSYTECTASCVGALARWLRSEGSSHPGLARQVEASVARGTALIRSRQLADGSYLGFWGVNFTYGIFHSVEGLLAAGVHRSDPAVARALAWLIAHQKSDGGWGEHWSSCMTDAYVEHPESQPAMTAWALLALAEGSDPASPDHAVILRAIERGRACLERLQEPGGGWPQKAQSGVFFSTSMLDYRLYKDIFPTWALARLGPSPAEKVEGGAMAMSECR